MQTRCPETTGQILNFPVRGPGAGAAAPIARLDLVEITIERLTGGAPQLGIVERIAETAHGPQLWVRRCGGPNGGTLRVIAARLCRRTANNPLHIY